MTNIALLFGHYGHIQPAATLSMTWFWLCFDLAVVCHGLATHLRHTGWHLTIILPMHTIVKNSSRTETIELCVGLQLLILQCSAPSNSRRYPHKGKDRPNLPPPAGHTNSRFSHWKRAGVDRNDGGWGVVITFVSFAFITRPTSDKPTRCSSKSRSAPMYVVVKIKNIQLSSARPGSKTKNRLPSLNSRLVLLTLLRHVPVALFDTAHDSRGFRRQPYLTPRLMLNNLLISLLPEICFPNFLYKIFFTISNVRVRDASFGQSTRK